MVHWLACPLSGFFVEHEVKNKDWQIYLEVQIWQSFDSNDCIPKLGIRGHCT